jgi:RND family efflux transporter MFP subunit
MEKEDLSKLKIEKSAKAFKPAKRRRTLLWVLMVLLLLTAGFLYFKGMLTPAVSVEVGTVSELYPSQVLSELSASGYVVAQRKAAVGSKITSRLVELSVEEGSRVKKGQVIARLENMDVLAARDQAEANLRLSRANLENAKAQLEEAAKTYRRYKQLVAGGYLSRAEYDTAEAAYQRAEAGVAAAEASVKATAAAVEASKVAIGYTLLRAPFDAVVLTKDADVGDIITPLGAASNAKAAVVTIADMNSLQVEADVSETNLAAVKVGQPCEIQLDALPGSRFRGSVHMIVPTADRTKATVMVKVRFIDKDSRILPEMRAKVSFLSRPVQKGEEKPRIVVNPSAIVTNGGKSAVFVVEENRVKERPVTLGASLGDMVEVVRGVKPGERIVLNPAKRLKEGSRIKIMER